MLKCLYDAGVKLLLKASWYNHKKMLEGRSEHRKLLPYDPIWDLISQDKISILGKIYTLPGGPEPSLQDRSLLATKAKDEYITRCLDVKQAIKVGLYSVIDNYEEQVSSELRRHTPLTSVLVTIVIGYNDNDMDFLSSINITSLIDEYIVGENEQIEAQGNMLLSSLDLDYTYI